MAELKSLQGNYSKVFHKAWKEKVISEAVSGLDRVKYRQEAEIRKRFTAQRNLLLENKERAIAGRLVSSDPRLRDSVDPDFQELEMEFNPIGYI